MSDSPPDEISLSNIPRESLTDAINFILTGSSDFEFDVDDESDKDEPKKEDEPVKKVPKVVLMD